MAINIDVNNATSAEIVELIINADPKDFPQRNDDDGFKIVKVTNFCSNACTYCTDNRNNWDSKRWRLSPEETVEAYKEAYDRGIRNFILYGGVDLFLDTDKICGLINKIKSAYADAVLYIAFGEKAYEAYQAFKDAGADGFILFHRSANEDHFAKLHTIEMYPHFRKELLPVLRGMGYRIGTGITVGLPMQTAEILQEDIAFVKDLKPDLVVVEAFEPQPHTTYEGHRRGDKKQTENVRGIVGSMLPDAVILTKF